MYTSVQIFFKIHWFCQPKLIFFWNLSPLYTMYYTTYTYTTTIISFIIAWVLQTQSTMGHFELKNGQKFLHTIYFKGPKLIIRNLPFWAWNCPYYLWPLVGSKLCCQDITNHTASSWKKNTFVVMQMKINFAYFEKNWEQSERQEASFAKS